ncbi:outer membrane lipoprotein carrier protein LolA, partial [Thermodesulfobacteriota bacterium]
TDTASGKIFIKRPDRMRWEYQKPESQTIVTDGKQLWIYRPEDNQVMVGRAPAFFKGGKGADFLADMQTIREKFIILMDLKVAQNHHILKLLPKEKMIDIDFINLWVTKKTFDVAHIITFNTYGDETRIQLSGFTFTERLDDALFIFKIPEGADVVQIDEANF